MPITFLGLDEVLAIHAHQIEKYGGSPGLRDPGLLASAIAMPQATFDGEFVHSDVHEMAGAYLFHLVKNHCFVDGNKRAGLACCLVFLRLNGVRVRATDDELVEPVVSMAAGETKKAAIAVFLREHAGRSRSGPLRARRR